MSGNVHVRKMSRVCSDGGMDYIRFTKERDERIELVVEMLQSEKEKIIGQHKNELKAKVEAVIADKLEIEKDLKDNKSKFSELSNTLLLVYSFLESPL